jgi:hypothetical protein
MGVVAVIAAMASVGAYAYWTTDGSGTGTATVGTDADNLVLHGSTTGSLYPDGPGVPVTFTVDNPSNFDQSVSKIHLDGIEACSAPYSGITCGGTVIATCGSINDGSVANAGTADFYMADVNVPPATDGNIQANAVAQLLATGGMLVMNNTSSNQDSCKNAYLLLDLSST